MRQGLNYVAQALLSFLIPSALTSGVAEITGVSHPGWLCHHVAETESWLAEVLIMVRRGHVDESGASLQCILLSFISMYYLI